MFGTKVFQPLMMTKQQKLAYRNGVKGQVCQCMPSIYILSTQGMDDLKAISIIDKDSLQEVAQVT